jgi:hypothetical protein
MYVMNLSYPHEAEWTPFQTHYFSENLVAPGIEHGASESVARISDHQTTEAVDFSRKLTENLPEADLLIENISIPNYNTLCERLQKSDGNLSFTN